MTVERAAEIARRELGLGLDGPVPDLLRLLEDEVELRIFILPLGEEGIDGAYQLDQGEPFVLLNQSKHHTRQRFTLAHEFGHHHLRHGAQLDSNIQFRNSQIKEIEANRFASSLLMPRPAIDGWFARNDDPRLSLEVLVRIAFAFNVSAPVVRYRLQEVNRLQSRSLRGELDRAIKAESHYEIARALGLVRPSDSIQASYTRGAYVPASMQAKVADLVKRGLLTPEIARARLRLPAENSGSEVDELFSSSFPAD
ncbi:MAG TPA: ImmA/IrrE family metallo-endopeptidase [Solirubrobacterales bacterium]|nr:ImmA/IrrE family metallo-endopeptidase [Solirubrobacterales bacterium]